MERGPVALFGALIAVGLGPALWLGAQFGQATTPLPQPPITVDANQDNAPGRAGAAPDESTDSTEILDSDGTGAGLVPLPSTPSAAPSTSTPTDIPSSGPTAPATATSPAPTRSTEPTTTPPTESTSTPVAEPSGEPSDEPTAPATLPPPANEQVAPLDVVLSNGPTAEG